MTEKRGQCTRRDRLLFLTVRKLLFTMHCLATVVVVRHSACIDRRSVDGQPTDEQ
jgi:hypothetical protein